MGDVDRVLSDYGIRNGSTLDLVVSMRIYVRKLNGPKEQVYVFPEDTVREVKLQILYQTTLRQLRPETLILLYGNRELADWQTMEHYNIRRDCTLTLFPRMTSGRLRR